MKFQKSIFFISILTLLFSCSEESVTGSSNGKRLFEPTENNKSRLAKIERVKFSYSIDTTYFMGNERLFILDCKLYNGNIDTLYFYTMSCYGWVYNFDYDTSKIQHFSSIDCCTSNPIIKSIPPKSDFKFKAEFFAKDRKTKKIKVQYYIYQVDANFNVRNSESIKKLEKKIIYN
jgi:hypothetical protein